MKSEGGGRGANRRYVDHLSKRHDVPGRGNDDDDGDLPDSAMPAEQNLVPSTAEVEHASDVTKEPSPGAGHSTTGSQIRRSQRARRAPEYLKDLVTF